jgi:type VI secretion system protein
MRILLALLSMAALAGCAASPPRIALRELSFEVAPAANDNMPFAVELVAVADEAVLAKLLALSAAQWFDPQSNLKRDYPLALQTWYYELTPGQRLELKPTPFAGRPSRGLLLFANYKTAGPYRLRLDTYEHASVLFGATAIEIAEPPH